MRCEGCADNIEYHKSGLCIHCRKVRRQELLEELKEVSE